MTWPTTTALDAIIGAMPHPPTVEPCRSQGCRQPHGKAGHPRCPECAELLPWHRGQCKRGRDADLAEAVYRDGLVAACEALEALRHATRDAFPDDTGAVERLEQEIYTMLHRLEVEPTPRGADCTLCDAIDFAKDLLARDAAQRRV